MAIIVNCGSGVIIARENKGSYSIFDREFWALEDYQDGSIIYVNPEKIVFYKIIDDNLADKIIDQAKVDRRIYVPREA